MKSLAEALSQDPAARKRQLARLHASRGAGVGGVSQKIAASNAASVERRIKRARFDDEDVRAYLKDRGWKRTTMGDYSKKIGNSQLRLLRRTKEHSSFTPPHSKEKRPPIRWKEGAITLQHQGNIMIWDSPTHDEIARVLSAPGKAIADMEKYGPEIASENWGAAAFKVADPLAHLDTARQKYTDLLPQ